MLNVWDWVVQPNCRRENPVQVTGDLVLGRGAAVLTGETTRSYSPEMRFFELEERTSPKCFLVEFVSHDLFDNEQLDRLTFP